jgi:hypothetical protein
MLKARLSLVNALPGQAEFQPVTQSARRKRQQIRAQPKDKNAS